MRTESTLLQLVEAGEPELAAITAIRALAAPEGAGSERARVLNDLAVLRFQAGDLHAAQGCIAEARRLAPDDPLVAENAAALKAPEHPGPGPEHPFTPDGAGPWLLDTLRWADQAWGLADRRVVEVGGTAPREVVAPFHPRSWVGCDPLAADSGDEAWGTRRAVAEALPFPDASADVVFSTCAFEHIHALDGALAEIARVLAPGGALLTQFAPIWTSAAGHHLRLPGTERGTLRFRDPIVPAWGHLLLSERELAFFLDYGLAPATARRAAAWIFHDPYLSRRTETDYRRAFAACGLQRRVLGCWGERTRLPRGLKVALEQAHPTAGRFDWPGFRVMLSKPQRGAVPATQ